jgi:hypothetical protein
MARRGSAASEIIPLQGRFNAELLGSGPAALSTPEVPRYAEMLGAVSQKIGLNLANFGMTRTLVPQTTKLRAIHQDAALPIGR